MPTQPPRLPPPAPEDAAARNMRLLVLLRWLAVGGQLATILIVHYGLDIRLPIAPMIVVLAALFMLNVMTSLGHPHWPVTNFQLFGTLVCDVVALSVQLYLSGGASNPFVSLYLLQVVMGAVLLHAWSSWALVALTSLALGLVAGLSPPLALPPWFATTLSPVYVIGLWCNFVLAAVLLVLFVTRIAANLRSRDAHLAAIVELIAPQGRLALIDDPERLDVGLLKRKSLSLHWEFMFTRSMFATADIAAQGALLDEVARLIDSGRLRTTLGEHYGRIDAANLRRAHGLIESGRARGKIVLEGFSE